MLCPQAVGQRHLFQLCLQNEMNISHGTVFGICSAQGMWICVLLFHVCALVWSCLESCGCLGGVLGKGCLWLAQICS